MSRHARLHIVTIPLERSCTGSGNLLQFMIANSERAGIPALSICPSFMSLFAGTQLHNGNVVAQAVSNVRLLSQNRHTLLLHQHWVLQHSDHFVIR